MAATVAAHRLTDADLERWVQSGLISVDQRDAMLRDLEAHQPTEDGLSVTTLLYYGGGLLVLLAYSVFLGFQWEELNEAGRVVISATSLVFFAVVSQLLLRSGRFQLPGELLQVVAVAIVPLLGFAALDAIGLWPEDPGFRRFSTQAREEYQTDLTWARMALAGATLIVALAAFRWSRSPFVMVAAAVSLTVLVLDVSIQLDGARRDYTWETPQVLIVAALGAGALTAGVATRGQSERDYSLWLYVMGLVGLTIGLGNKAFDSNAAGWGTLWMISALILLVLSVTLQQRLFAAAGLAAIFAFLAKLVFDVFESANAALVLVVLGLLILGTGMLYQRYSERLFARPQDG